VRTEGLGSGQGTLLPPALDNIYRLIIFDYFVLTCWIKSHRSQVQSTQTNKNYGLAISNPGIIKTITDAFDKTSSVHSVAPLKGPRFSKLKCPYLEAGAAQSVQRLATDGSEFESRSGREAHHSSPTSANWLEEKSPLPESASELYRPSDRRLSAKLLPTLADRGCHVVSVTDPYGSVF
jgi:hypothetical protein